MVANISGPPTFPTQLSLPRDCAKQIASCRATLAQHIEIVNIMEDMAKFTIYLESEVTRTNGLVYASTVLCASYINPLLHRLLNLISTTVSDINSDGTTLKEACRLSCILYLAELRRSFGVMPVWTHAQLAKLHVLFENSSELHTWDGLGVIRLWILALAITEEREEEQRRWWLERLKSASREEGLRSMTEVTDKLRQFMWMDLHENKFKPFEQEALEES